MTKMITADNGVLIRKMQPPDIDEYIKLRGIIDCETEYMAARGGERYRSNKRIAKSLEEGSKTILVAEKEAALVGFVAATRGSFLKRRHIFSLGVGVIKAEWGKGIGKGLMQQIESISLMMEGIRRLELEVFETNTRAIQLYEKMGYEREGVKRGAVCLAGVYSDSIMMSKLL